MEPLRIRRLFIGTAAPGGNLLYTVPANERHLITDGAIEPQGGNSYFQLSISDGLVNAPIASRNSWPVAESFDMVNRFVVVDEGDEVRCFCVGGNAIILLSGHVFTVA